MRFFVIRIWRITLNTKIRHPFKSNAEGYGCSTHYIDSEYSDDNNLVADSRTTCRLGLGDEFGNFWIRFHMLLFQESEHIKYTGVQRKCYVRNSKLKNYENLQGI